MKLKGNALGQGESNSPHQNFSESRMNTWATEVAVLILGGNSSVALSQIKVARSVTDLPQLRNILNAGRDMPRQKHIDVAVLDQIDALPAPRLYRPP